jgi:hypothetical protein
VALQPLQRNRPGWWCQSKQLTAAADGGHQQGGVGGAEHEASPAGNAKLGTVADMLLGARVGGVARALRTAPPAYAAGAGASSLTYSALYPLARLAAPAGDFAPAALAAPVEELRADAAVGEAEAERPRVLEI